MTPADVIRSVVNEYNGYTADEIADKLAAEGMLWCGSDLNPRIPRSESCPMHHLFMARLQAAGHDPPPELVGVGSSMLSVVVADGEREFISNGRHLYDSPIADFIGAYDRGDYNQLEQQP